ncbi:shikimate dehydrogenase [Temperatibacter marinus]|uniref:Shikimate dehydrogenase (NADP(+)) n=1 Tax=Temperatibacter marinus TaxID=1456591 RepID=A0AA52EI95_9PROT|nr:shikimate dehydrogenase [Temperatibacter marinus]WND03663.1 shikimate dehydrogenase [Temperatibacter marinus]
MTYSSIKRAAVIGWPIGQSLSPLIHKHWFERYEIAGEYRKIAVEPDHLETALQGFIRGNEFIPDGLDGFNITVPHKEKVIPFLDKVAPMAKRLGAVNTVMIKDGVTTGFNTDITGLKKQLDVTVPDWPKERPVLILGAGGAARATISAFLSTEVPFIMLSNRTKAKAEVLANELGQGRVTVVDWDDRHDAVTGAGVVVNTSSLGMVGQPPLELDLSHADPETVVYDIVYKPLETPLLKSAKDRGLRTVDGLGMLVYQAAGAFKIWFGVDPDYDSQLKEKLLAAL